MAKITKADTKKANIILINGIRARFTQTGTFG
jgi:hypothetical protein